MSSKQPYNLEINLTKSKWEPKTIADIPLVISRAFETHVTLKEIQPIIGTDHIVKFPLKEDKDIPVFMEAKSQMNEAFAEKVIKFTVPRGLMPSRWQPKKVKILARGKRLSKYFGEDHVSSRQVEVSVKFFDCGHFYMKQSLPGSGAAPYQIVFEGKYKQSDKGFHLDYYIRYTGQTSKKSEFDNAVSILPPNLDTFLAYCDESDKQLNGLAPAIVGGEQTCRIEIYREPDVVDDSKARFNEDAADPPSWEWKEPTQEEREAHRKKQREKEREKERAASPPAEEEEDIPLLTKDKTKDEMPVPRSRPSTNQPRPAAAATPAAPAPAAPTRPPLPTRQDDDGKGEEVEPLGAPMICGLLFFGSVLALFGWLNWQDWTAGFPVEEDPNDWFR